MLVEKPILTNINTSRITEFLKKKDIRREEGDKGMEYIFGLQKL